MQRLTLAQQIAQLEDTAPTDFDPEDVYRESNKANVGADNDGDVGMDNQDPTAGREHYVDVGPSDLRKMRDSIADPKYDGVKTSRNQLLADGEEEEEKEARDDSLDEDHQDPVTPMDDAPPSAFEAEAEDEDEDALQNETTEPKRIRDLSPRPNLFTNAHQDQALTSSLRDTRAADKLKGKAVARQLSIWDSLVDARIRLQKSVTAANKLPHPEHIDTYVSRSAGRAAAHGLLSEALQLSEELFELRHTLLAKKDLDLPPRKKRKIAADEDDVDYETLVAESTTEMMALDADTHPDTLATLQKWSAKVQAVAPSALLSSSRVSFKTGPAHIKSATELVEEALRDQDKVVKRTWGKRYKGARIGSTQTDGEDDEGDDEAFDDRDFYQGMLRDVIESKGGRDGLDPAELQANSKKQKKKIVDTKASKGRKIRYEPHEKLQHFMAPVPVRGTWHEEQIDELFASLLGKGFEGNGVGGDIEPRTVDEETHALQGFRVFG